MVTLFGIKNCDTVKKARRWLEAESVEYTFHDFRVDGIDAKQISQWLDTLGADTLINKRSTTWKSLSDEQKKCFSDATDSMIELIVENPTLIKRPVTATDKELMVGFKEAQYTSLFK